MENTKRDLSLDFTKPRHLRGGQPAPSLFTPTLYTPNLTTPELNKMISGEELAILTPNGVMSVISHAQPNLPSSPLIPTTVNSNNIINNNNTACNNNNNNNNNNNGNSSNQNSHTTIQKRSDNNKPRDLDVEKIEKKRERNRLAAKKCRQRKLETIDELRKENSGLKQKYESTRADFERLHAEFERFKALKNKEVEQLKTQLSESERFNAQRNKEVEQLSMQLSELKCLISQ